jgi:hypothetical protein
MKINKWIYRGLVIGQLIICFNGVHGVFIPVFLLEILLLITSIGTNDVPLHYSLIIGPLITLQVWVVFKARLTLKTTIEKIKVIIPLIILAIAIVSIGIMQENTDSQLFYWITSIPFLFSSIYAITNLSFRTSIE